MTERLNGAGTGLLERPQDEEREVPHYSPETPRNLAQRALVLEVIEADEPEPASLLSQGKVQAEYAVQGPGMIFNSKA